LFVSYQPTTGRVQAFQLGYMLYINTEMQPPYVVMKTLTHLLFHGNRVTPLICIHHGYRFSSIHRHPLLHFNQRSFSSPIIVYGRLKFYHQFTLPRWKISFLVSEKAPPKTVFAPSSDASSSEKPNPEYATCCLLCTKPRSAVVACTTYTN
jgi:hypothetical protein